MSGYSGFQRTQEALYTPFVPNRNSSGLISSTVQGALEELAQIQKGFLSAANTVNSTQTVSSTSTTNVKLSFASNSGGANVTGITPAAGRYLIVFNCNATTDGTNAEGEFSLFYGTTQLQESVRTIRSTTALLGVVTLSSANTGTSITSMASCIANGTTEISAQFRRSVAGGTVYAMQRFFALLRVGSS